MSRILINATQKEQELRVVVVENQKLRDFDFERTGKEQKIANIYKGVIKRIEKSLRAAFVDYGAERHGFLPLKEIASSYYGSNYDADSNERPNIADLLHEGQEVMVQVEKEERGNKGAALSTYISLAGSYLVLMPNNARAGGISRRIEGEERDNLRQVMNQIVIPDEVGVIVRTAGVGKSQEELQWDLDVLLKLWDAIQESFTNSPAKSFLIHQESDVVVRTLRDYLREDTEEILVDDSEVFARAQKHIARVRPNFMHKIKLYQDVVPLFSRFHVEEQIETAFKREVTLPSGGAVVIDHTEALISIDINSAKATLGDDIEETALNTNLEAADEIARQLRLRDLGGLIVIDFIDMTPIKHQREVESRLREKMAVDRARVQIGRISRFGLLEMSRQRLRPSLREATQVICPRCNGIGTIRNIEFLALTILRLLAENAVKNTRINRMHVQVPIEVATYILNEKRQSLSEIEESYKFKAVIIPNPHMHTPQYKIDRFFTGEQRERQSQASYLLADDAQVEIPESSDTQIKRDEPAVKEIDMGVRPTAKKAGILKRILKAIFGGNQEKSKRKHTSKSHSQQNRRSSHNRQQNKRGNYNNRGGSNRNSSNRNSSNRNSSNRNSSNRNSSNRNSSNRDNSNRDNSNRDNRNRDNSNRDNRNRSSDDNRQSNRRNDNRSNNSNYRSQSRNRSQNYNNRDNSNRRNDSRIERYNDNDNTQTNSNVDQRAVVNQNNSSNDAVQTNNRMPQQQQTNDINKQVNQAPQQAAPQQAAPQQAAPQQAAPQQAAPQQAAPQQAAPQQAAPQQAAPQQQTNSTNVIEKEDNE